MNPRHLQLGSLIACVLLAGCSMNVPAPRPPEVYPNAGYKQNIPDFMQGTIFERTEVANDMPWPVTAYSLVVNLQGTGDNSELPGTVRNAILKHMQLVGFGSHNDPRYTALSPDRVLNDPRVAVVEVEGRLPVGARKGQRFDIIVRAIRHSNTSSLAHGHLYRTELYSHGLELPDSHGMTLAYADSGDVFVNPQYALLEGRQPTEITASLRHGVVLGAGEVVQDRPIFLQLRVPEARLARAIEYRVTNRFQQDEDIPAGQARDAGIVSLYVPVAFNGDWQHFMAIVNHLYLEDTPEFNVQRVRQLIADAKKPNPPLTDISFCLEGLGNTVVPLYIDMMESPDPNLAYCAARAAACVGDHGAIRALVQMAIDSNCPYQLAAVHTLGQLQQSPSIDDQLESLLSSDQRLVRIEAYKILSAHNDRRITSENINDKFALDYVDCGGPPLIYATVEGAPRLAVFGTTTSVTTPITYMAMQDRLTIASDDADDLLTIFYRDPTRQDPVKAQLHPKIFDLIARLGGIGPGDEPQLDFSYCDVVSILSALTGQHLLVGADDMGNPMLTQLALETPPELQAIEAVPSVGPSQRPQGGPVPAQLDPLAPPGQTLPAPGASASDTSGTPQPAPPSGGPQVRSTPAAVPSFGQ